MEFCVLGPLEVRGPAGVVGLGGGKPRALLAALVLEGNRVVSRERLIDALWGEDPPESAVKLVQLYVSQWRKLLPAGVLVTRPPGYLLEVASDAVDLWRFERLVADAQSTPPAQAAVLLGEALALWRGPALAEFSGEPLLRVEGARLDELRLAALEGRFEAELASGRAVELVAELEAAVERWPLRENLRAVLMLALYRSGRQADALAVYRVGRGVLDELGLEPGLRLRELERRILAQDVALEPGPKATDAHAVPATVPALASVVERRELRKTVTVLFCDLAGSMALGEEMDPEALRLLLNRYFARMKAVVERHGGVVDKFVGDAVVAVFGALVAHEDDALRALRAAAEMRAALPELELGARFGINTGEVVTGADDRLTTGDVVNVAARLQQAASPGEILLGAQTRLLVGGAVNVEELPPLELEGRRDPVAPFRLLKVGEAPERPHAGPFVGRSRELAMLHEAWTRVVGGGRCELVTVVGEAGVGKSRLIGEFVAGLDAPVARGSCLSYGEGITYWPVVNVVRQLGVTPADPVAAAAIGSLLGEGDAAVSAEEIAWAFRKLLEQASPLVVVFDDIQWGEETFLDLVEHLVLLSAGAPLLVVCMARPELTERRPHWPISVKLEPLPPGDVERLLPASVPLGLRERIARAAGGNPLFVMEMVAMAAEASSEDVVVPGTLKALLAARLDQLEASERGVLERGAVEGEVFHRGAVQALTPGEGQITPRLAALVRKELIRPHRSQLPAEDGFRFCHLLIRDAAYDALPKSTRAVLHERFAGWLAQHTAGLVERDELLGYHLEQAHRYRTELGLTGVETRTLAQRAAGHLAAAGGLAADRGDYPAAISLIDRALTLGTSDEGERARVQLELAKLLVATMRQPERALALRDEALETAIRLGDRGLIAHARLALGLTYPFPGWDVYEEQEKDRRRICEEAIALFTALGDERGLTLALQALAELHINRGRSGAARAGFEQALAQAETAGQPFLRQRVIGLLVVFPLSAGPVPVREAIDRCEELRQLSAGQPTREAAIWCSLCMLHVMAAQENRSA